MKASVRVAAVVTLLTGFPFVPGCCFTGTAIDEYTVEGKVVDGDGRPINGWVGITAYEVDPEHHFSELADQCTHSDAEGQFRLQVGWPGLDIGFCVFFGTVSEYPPPDSLYVYVLPEDGHWRMTPIPLSLSAKQRELKVLDLGTVTVPSQ
jgi:hypothetical protein